MISDANNVSMWQWWRQLEMDVQESEGTLAAGEKRYREKLHSIRHRHEAEIRALEKEHAAKVISSLLLPPLSDHLHCLLHPFRV